MAKKKAATKKTAAKKKSAAVPSPGDANDHYNAGLRLMGTIERPLRSGQLSPADRKVADDAEKSLKTALEIAPNHGRAMIMLGMLYRFTGRFKEAVPHLESAMGLPRDGDDWTKAVDTLAGVHMQTKNHTKAVALLQDAIKDHPADEYLVHKLAACHYELKKPKEAIRVLEDGLRAAPSNALLTQALLEIQQATGQAQQIPQPQLPPDQAALMKKAEALGQEMQEKIESIMNGAGSAQEKADGIAKAQEEFQAAVTKLYSS